MRATTGSVLGADSGNAGAFAKLQRAVQVDDFGHPTPDRPRHNRRPFYFSDKRRRPPAPLITFRRSDVTADLMLDQRHETTPGLQVAAETWNLDATYESGRFPTLTIAAGGFKIWS